MGYGKDLESLIDSIYDTAITASSWRPLLENLLSPLDVIASDIYLFRNNELLYTDNAGGPEEGFKEYREYYHHIALRGKIVQHVPAGQIFTDRQFISEEKMRRDPFYEEWLKQWDFRHALMVPLIKENDALALMAVHRNISKGPPEEQDFAIFRMLVPHLQRAAMLYYKLHDMRRQNELYAESLDRLTTGVVLLDNDSRVLHVNSAAEWIISRYPRLCMENGNFILRQRGARDWLNNCLADILAGSPTQPCDGGAHGFPADAAGAHLSLYVTPVSASVRASTGAAAMLYITDPSLEIDKDKGKMLGKLYNLTPAETALATALLDGQTLKQHADERCVSFNTVRTHLRGLFRKTRTNRQSELVARLLTATGHIK